MWWCEAVDGEYEGERNAAGEMEGLGTKRYAVGSVYDERRVEGESSYDKGRGTMRA